MVDQTLLKKYAQVILEVGVNLQKGQNVLIDGEPIHWDFIALLAAEAYKMGAQYVAVKAHHPKLLLARVQFADESTLSYVPTSAKAELDTLVKERWTAIFLDGMEDPDIYDSLNQDRNAIVHKANQTARYPFSQAMVQGICHWVIVALPTPKWAAKIFNMEPSTQAVDRMWQVMIPILQLDKSDPVEAWRKQSQLIQQRANTLNHLNYHYVHFVGPNTDLKVYLTNRSEWAGGTFESKDRGAFLANLPTYEVFTTPHRLHTQGRVQVTRPVKIMGSDVEEAWFEFKDGAVINYGAKKGQGLLEKYFAMDENARYLGEVALVDIESPIFKSNTIFNSILYDENAACHIALGRGLISCIKGADGLTKEELTDIGFNQCVPHLDFMIGAPDVSVFGGSETGQESLIISKGVFVI